MKPANLFCFFRACSSIMFPLTFFSSMNLIAQEQSEILRGDFTDQCDVGSPIIAGSSSYDPEAQTYTVAGAGKNMWLGNDEFHFVYRQIEGDFILRFRASFPDTGIDPHRKLGWIVRSNLTSGSPHVNAAVHGDGLTSLQFRREADGLTEELKSELTRADVIQLQRHGNRYTMSVARFGQPFVVSSLDNLELGNKVYIGLFVCSHNPDVIEKAIFKDVRITVPAADDLVRYREFIGSRLETIDVESGNRRVLFTTTEGIEAPNWTRDGKQLIYNSKGQLFHYSITQRKSQLLDTGFATRCNNDHVLSFDGSQMGISHNSLEDKGASVIFTLPSTGGEPYRVTAKSPSYLHGWSPDGKSLIYTGQRDGDFDIYRIAAEGGDEVRLTTSKGLDDGPKYSPDAKQIYFNSARTGVMQLYRMNQDGSDQQQLTDDEFNDWFPHVSPDGKWVVFLSFSKDVAADQHPFYHQVYLRMMPAGGGVPKIIAYIYGGQGTINVPSWSPDSKRVAFVSHSN